MIWSAKSGMTRSERKHPCLCIALPIKSSLLEISEALGLLY